MEQVHRTLEASGGVTRCGHKLIAGETHLWRCQVGAELFWFQLDSKVVLIDCFCERLSPAVGGPWLGLQDQNAPRSQMPVDPAEHSLQPVITPVQVHPLGEAEAEHHIILRSLGIHQLISVQDIVTLWATRGEDVTKGWPHNHLRTEKVLHTTSLQPRGLLRLFPTAPSFSPVFSSPF